MRRLLMTLGACLALAVASAAPAAADDRVECERFDAIVDILQAQGRALNDEGFTDIAEWFETLAKAEKNCAT